MKTKNKFLNQYNINGRMLPLLRHQVKAVKKARKYFRKNTRGRLHHCCRSGKTITSIAISKDVIGAKDVAYFAPNISLLKQTSIDWLNNVDDAEIIFVTQDKTCSESFTSTNPRKLSEKISQVKADGKNVVIFSTFSSAKRVSQALETPNLANFSFDFLVIDEAHNSVGINRKQTTFIHFNDRIRSNYRLYMTATPKSVSDQLKSKAPTFSFVASMDDNSKIFGDEIHSLSFCKAIKRNILSDYKIMGILCSDENLVEAIKDSSNISHMEIEETAKKVALEQALKQSNASHCVSFHSNVTKARFLEKNFNLKGFKVFHINSEYSASDRDKIIKEFEASKKGLLTNCKCLSEGITIPKVDSVWFPDAKHSEVDIVQSASRCLTQHSSKVGKLNYVMIPTFHTEDESADAICTKPEHKTLFAVLEHMHTYDERIQASLRHHCESLGSDSQDYEEIVEFVGYSKELKKKLFLEHIPSFLTKGNSSQQRRADQISEDELWSVFIKNNGVRYKVSTHFDHHESWFGNILKLDRFKNLKQKVLKWEKSNLPKYISDSKIWNAFLKYDGDRVKTSEHFGFCRNWLATLMRSPCRSSLSKKIHDWEAKNKNLVKGSLLKDKVFADEELWELFVKCDGHGHKISKHFGKNRGWFNKTFLNPNSVRYDEPFAQKCIAYREKQEEIRKQDVDVDAVIKAYVENKGNKQKTCRSLGRPINWLNNRLAHNLELRERIDAYDQENAITGEKILQALKDNDFKARDACETLGKGADWFYRNRRRGKIPQYVCDAFDDHHKQNIDPILALSADELWEKFLEHDGSPVAIDKSFGKNKGWFQSRVDLMPDLKKRVKDYREANKPTTSKILAVYRKHKGVLTRTAKELGYSTYTIRAWTNKDQKLFEGFQKIEEEFDR